MPQQGTLWLRYMTELTEKSKTPPNGFGNASKANASNGKLPRVQITACVLSFGFSDTARIWYVSWRTTTRPAVVCVGSYNSSSVGS
ncbi:hypothetical protein T4E_7323 [Trichinella pseudospiralis]|uniref:Uncharacterized protein n=1 Tax=Trichinella pseudospiralis TaxID=6337 RepID=A0A0V0Y982_TRIPS|nr:hypothetical protein T4E_7323 [Trichinella pseudospiralis]